MVNQESKIILLPITPWSPAGLHANTFACGGVGCGVVVEGEAVGCTHPSSVRCAAMAV